MRVVQDDGLGLGDFTKLSDPALYTGPDQVEGLRARANFPFTPETPRKGTYNELLRLIKTNFDRGLILRSFSPIFASTTFGQVFLLWENGEYLAYLITDVDASTAFSTG